MPVAAAIPYIVMGGSMLGSMASARAQQSAGNASAAAYEYNARISESDAVAAKDQADYEEQKSREEATKLAARQRVLYAKAGVEIGSGSPLLVMADDAAQAEKDALAIRFQGATTSAKYKNQANLYRMYGENAEESGEKQSNATLLQGIGTAGVNYAIASGVAKKNYYSKEA